MGPASPTVAWDIGAKGDDPVQMYLADIYTLSVSLAGLPGMSVPCGFGAGANAKRPVGLQIIGNYFNEARMLQVADAFQRVTDWHKQVPAGGDVEPPHSLRSLPPEGAHASLEAARREV